MNLIIRPTDTEYVDIEHCGWGARWAMQFPEAIDCSAGTFLAWPPIHPTWQRRGEAAWGYTWRPPADYEQQVHSLDLKTDDGRPQYTRFVSDAELRAEIAAGDREIRLTLTIVNTGRQTLRGLRSEGGCFQAKSDAFRDGDEVARSYVACGGAMTSLAKLHRTIPVRCRYVSDLAQTDAAAMEWFWGRSEAVIDRPTIVGAVSRDSRHAVVLGYEHAADALANADEWHHCLHSCPQFGELTPGRSVTRRGWIMFGDDIQALARELAARMARDDGAE